MSGENYTMIGGVKVPLPKAPKPYPQWLAEQPAEELKQRAIQRALKRKSGGRKKRTYRRKSFRRSSGSNAARPLIASIGTVKGAGAYSIHGGMEGELFGQKYNIGGFYNSDPVVGGLGEYNVKRNSLMGMIDLGQGVPRVMNTNKGEATIINHRDYLGDMITGPAGVGGSSQFKLDTYALNPGNTKLFPFLGTIAQKFQEYEVRGCLVELKTLSSDYAASLSMGAMFAAADYNVLGAAPHTKQQIENMEYASSCKPSKTLIMPIECDPRNDANTHLYVASDNNYQGGDKRLFDLCNIYLGSQGVPVANTPIAEIWVTYEIALFKPIITTADASPEPLSAHFYFRDWTSAKPLGTVQAAAKGTDAGFQLLSDGETIDFPGKLAKNYIVVINWSDTNSTGATVSIPTIQANGAMSIISQQFSTTAGYFQTDVLKGGEATSPYGHDNCCAVFLCRMKDPGNAGQFDGGITVVGGTGALPGNGTGGYGDIHITEMSHNLYSYEWDYATMGPVPTDDYILG